MVVFPIEMIYFTYELWFSNVFIILRKGQRSYSNINSILIEWIYWKHTVQMSPHQKVKFNSRSNDQRETVTISPREISHSLGRFGGKRRSFLVSPK